MAGKNANQLKGYFPKVSKPALRALHNAGFVKLEQLSQISKKDLSKLHGMGPQALGILERALSEQGLAFKQEP